MVLLIRGFHPIFPPSGFSPALPNFRLTSLSGKLFDLHITMNIPNCLTMCGIFDMVVPFPARDHISRGRNSSTAESFRYIPQIPKFSGRKYSRGKNHYIYIGISSSPQIPQEHQLLSSFQHPGIVQTFGGSAMGAGARICHGKSWEKPSLFIGKSSKHRLFSIAMLNNPTVNKNNMACFLELTGFPMVWCLHIYIYVYKYD